MIKDSNRFSNNRPKHLNRVYTQKKVYEQYLPLDEAELKNIKKIERYKIVYNSNKMEGNTYTECESNALLDTGKPSISKPLKDGIEISNLNRAILFMDYYKGDLTVDFIKFLHRIVTAGTLSNPSDEGQFKKVRNWVGDLNTCPPNGVEKEMNKLIDYYKENLGKLDIIVLASKIKYRFLVTHPFVDGNGRVSRLLFNYIIESNGFIPVIITDNNRSAYYKALKDSNFTSKENKDKFRCDELEEFMCNCLCESYERRIYMLEGDFE